VQKTSVDARSSQCEAVKPTCEAHGHCASRLHTVSCGSYVSGMVSGRKISSRGRGPSVLTDLS
jgi:hypothetical protein